jgi:small subunit ribosomal protein S11
MPRLKENKMAEEKETKKIDEVKEEVVEESEEVATNTLKETSEGKKSKEVVEKNVDEVKKIEAPKGVPSEEGKVKKRRDIEAIVNIYTSFNNTIVHVTDMSGKTITKVTGGMVTKHDRLKANPTIAMFISKRISENMKELGVTSLYVRIRVKTGNPSPGPGANALVKSLTREGFKILNILDVSRIPRGGPKKKGGRRGRRP